MQMVAKKRVKYPHGHGGREYAPGQVFEVLSDRDAKGLFIAGKAGYSDAASTTAKVSNATDLPKAVPTPEPDIDDLTALRGEYRTRMGKAAYNGWDAEEIRRRMAAQTGEPRSGEYRRRDLRAEE